MLHSLSQPGWNNSSLGPELSFVSLKERRSVTNVHGTDYDLTPKSGVLAEEKVWWGYTRQVSNLLCVLPPYLLS